MGVEVSARLVESYRTFLNAVKPTLGTIYYPSCGGDASAAEVFDGRIIYVDKSREESVDAMKEAGLEVHLGDSNRYRVKGGVDAVILQNPAVDVDGPLANLRVGGYVLCNNYHSSASDVRKKSNYRFLGVALALDDKIVWDTENLADYFKPVETEDELKAAPSSFGMIADYDGVVQVVEAVTGKRENLIEEYNKLLAQAEQHKESLIEEFGEEQAEIIMGIVPLLEHNGQTYPVPPLPPKKGTTDDLFVFVRES